MPQSQNEPTLKIFLSYAHEDAVLVNQLRKHLRPLEDSGRIRIWGDFEIRPGNSWNEEIVRQLRDAHVFMPLISIDFLASDFLMNEEFRMAMERYEAGQLFVLPVLLRPSDWTRGVLAKLQVLPRGAKPVTSWQNLDEAWIDVVSGLGLVVEEVLEKTKTPTNEIFPTAEAPIYQLYEVFKQSGLPTVTFVEHEDFPLLRMALANPGRGVVVEGPSGIGKTTSLRKAAPEIPVYSARVSDHVERLRNIRTKHSGPVAVDDFHRLPPDLQQDLTDYLKYLADYEEGNRKLVIVGIPRTGEKLVTLGFDVATRIDVFKLGRVSDGVVDRMIQKGEQALNVDFSRRSQLVSAADGSLNIGQLLCFNACALEGVSATQSSRLPIGRQINPAISKVMSQVSLKFAPTVRFFASFGDRRDHTGIAILSKLAESEGGYLSLPQLALGRPDLQNGIQRFISDRFMDNLYVKVPDSRHHVLYDDAASAIVIDDPQLTFFIRQTPPSELVRVTGKTDVVLRDRVFVSYSHRDKKWLDRLRVHLTPIEREGVMQLWDDTAIRPGQRWRDEIRAAIDASRVAVLLVSADFLASDFITSDELPPLLKMAETEGLTVIPVIISPSLYNQSQLREFQALNPLERPLIGMERAEQEAMLVRLATVIVESLGLA